MQVLINAWRYAKRSTFYSADVMSALDLRVAAAPSQVKSFQFQVAAEFQDKSHDLSGVSSQRNERTERKERKKRKNRKLQPIRTELSFFLLNSSFWGLKIRKK